MKNYSILAMLFLPFLFSSCKKEPYPSVINDAVFSCTEVQTDYFFEGELDGERFCYHVGENDYDMFLHRTTRFITSTPTLTVGDTSSVGNSGTFATWTIRTPIPESHLKHYIEINSPAFAVGTDLKTIIDSTIHEGELLLASNNINRMEGFNVNLAIPHGDDNSSDISTALSFFESLNGKQENSYLRITELEIAERLGVLFYTVTFEFACDLYYFGNPDKHFGRLENGILRMAFEIEK